jgi:hypothetical protein
LFVGDILPVNRGDAEALQRSARDLDAVRDANDCLERAFADMLEGFERGQVRNARHKRGDHVVADGAEHGLERRLDIVALQVLEANRREVELDLVEDRADLLAFIFPPVRISTAAETASAIAPTVCVSERRNCSSSGTRSRLKLGVTVEPEEAAMRALHVVIAARVDIARRLPDGLRADLDPRVRERERVPAHEPVRGAGRKFDVSEPVSLPKRATIAAMPFMFDSMERSEPSIAEEKSSSSDELSRMMESAFSMDFDFAPESPRTVPVPWLRLALLGQARPVPPPPPPRTPSAAINARIAAAPMKP